MYRVNKLTHNWLIKNIINNKIKERLPYLYGRIIDLGCGTRPFEKDILKHANEYIGVDWGNTYHNLNAEIISDLNKPLPIPSSSFDHVVSFEVLEHLQEPLTMLSEAFRILKPGGSITLSVPFMWWVHEAPWDYFRYTKFGIYYIFQKAGFKDIEIHPTTGFWSMWLLKINYQTNKLVRGPKYIRKIIKLTLIPFWFINQTIAPFLDKIWQEENETAGYFVTASKP